MPVKTPVVLGLLLSLAGALTHGHAATLTVGPGQSLQQALSSMSGGDTLIIKGGTYAEGNLTPPSGTTIRAASGETVVIQPDNQGVDTIFDFRSGSRDITIDGVVLDAGGKTGFPVYGAADVAGITIKNSEIKGGRHSGLLLAGSNWNIQGNYIHDNGTDTTYDHGIYFYGDNSRIVGNRLERNACFNIQNYGSSGGGYHNIYEGNLFTASGCGWVASTGSDITFRGNIMVDDGTQNPAWAMQAYVDNMVIEGNTFVNLSVITRGNSGIVIRNNQVCNGQLNAPGTEQSGNRFSCDGLPALDRVPGASTPPPTATLPAPRNLRVVSQP